MKVKISKIVMLHPVCWEGVKKVWNDTTKVTVFEKAFINSREDGFYYIRNGHHRFIATIMKLAGYKLVGGEIVPPTIEKVNIIDNVEIDVVPQGTITFHISPHDVKKNIIERFVKKLPERFIDIYFPLLNETEETEDIVYNYQYSIYNDCSHLNNFKKNLVKYIEIDSDIKAENSEAEDIDVFEVIDKLKTGIIDKVVFWACYAVNFTNPDEWDVLQYENGKFMLIHMDPYSEGSKHEMTEEDAIKWLQETFKNAYSIDYDKIEKTIVVDDKYKRIDEIYKN